MRTFDGRWLALAAVVVMTACTCGRPEGKECTGDGSCDPGQICGAMKICEIQKVCPELPCATDQVCVNARCLNTKCGAVQCAMNQVCSGGVCTDISCVGKSCPGGTCIGGSCYPNEGCEFASCVPNTEICIADTCVPTKCLGVTCPGDQRCAADGKCYPRGGTGGNSGTGPGPDGDGGFGAGGFGGGNGSGGSSGGSSGTGGSSGGSSGTGGSSGGSSGTGGSSGGSSGTGGSGGGSGIGACNGMCTPLQVCINNQCVETRCVGVSCPAGQACSNGQCVPTGCGVNGAMCPPGQVCSSTGTCVDPSCGNVSCPTSYYCRGGLCTLQLPDGGYPQEADGGGTTVVINPNGGGVIGIKGPDGGLLIGSDGGAIGAPCLPGKCDEVICNNNVDENGNGLSDCADPACNTRSCDDGNRCTFAERCVAGACQPARTVTCNTPPPGQCWSNPGVCTPMETCEYDLALGKACTSPSNYVCGVDGGCVPQAVQPGLFNYVPSNFDPATLSPVSRAAIPAGETVTLNTSTQQITGNWNPQPAFQVVNTSTGEALVASARDMSFGTGSYLRVVGSRPLILVAFSVFEVKGTIDVSANGATPGPGGDVNCGSSNGGNGSFGLLSAAGAGGAGAPGGNNRWGGNGGGGSTFATLGSGGAPRNDAATALVGGCHGGTGGTAGVTTGGIGGAGGGVLQISVSSGFNINGGTLLANGGFGSAGAMGNNESRGGGGGGSGGKILIEGQYVLSQPTGRIQANGGGGGEGTGWTYGGRNGGQPDVYQVLWGGQGGNGAWFNAGNGGDGGGWWQAAGYHGQSALSFLFGENNASSWESGGGGGGGSAGAIYVRVGGTDNQCVLRSDRVTHSPRLATNSADNCSL